MVLDTSLLNTYQYKVHIKGKVEQCREKNSDLPYTSIEKGAFWSPSTTLTNHIYIYIVMILILCVEGEIKYLYDSKALNYLTFNLFACFTAILRRSIRQSTLSGKFWILRDLFPKSVWFTRQTTG